MAVKSSRQTMRAGAFFLVALVVFAGAALWVVGSDLVRGASIGYTVMIPNAGTLAVGDPVVIAGVPVGDVTGMNLKVDSPDPVSLQVEISPAAKLRADSTARVVLRDLLGGTALRIDPGSPRTEPLKPGDTINGIASASPQAMLAKADRLAVRTMSLMRRTEQILSTVSRKMPATVQSLARFSESAASVAGRLNKMTLSFERTVPRVLKRTDTASVRALNVLDRAQTAIQQLENLSSNLNQALGGRGARVTTLLDEAQAAFRGARDAMAVVSDNRLVIERALRSFSRTAASLEGFSSQIKERPYSLIRVLPTQDRVPGEPMQSMP